MKKLAGLLIVMLLGFIESGSTFTLLPLQTVTAPISINNRSVNMTVQVNVIYLNMAVSPPRFDPSPGAQVRLVLNYPGHSPITLNGVANSQGIATIPVTWPTPTPSTVQYDASATWGVMTGLTNAPTINIYSGMPNPAPVPVLVQ